MKKTMILTSLFAVVIGIMACSNETDITYAPQQSITIAQKSLSIGNNGAVSTLKYQATMSLRLILLTLGSLCRLLAA